MEGKTLRCRTNCNKILQFDRKDILLNMKLIIKHEPKYGNHYLLQKVLMCVSTLILLPEGL